MEFNVKSSQSEVYLFCHNVLSSSTERRA